MKTTNWPSSIDFAVVDDRKGFRSVFDPPFHPFPNLPRRDLDLLQEVADHLMADIIQMLG